MGSKPIAGELKIKIQILSLYWSLHLLFIDDSTAVFQSGPMSSFRNQAHDFDLKGETTASNFLGREGC